MNAKKIANNANAIAKAKADWVKAMTEDFYADEKKNPLNIGAVGVGNTIIVAYADNVDEPLIGVAKCNPTDSYDREVGIAIAYARAIGEDIPDYVLSTYEDEDDDWDDEDELSPFGELGIGAKFIDCDTLYIKVDNNKAYNYNTKTIITISDEFSIDEVVED